MTNMEYIQWEQNILLDCSTDLHCGHTIFTVILLFFSASVESETRRQPRDISGKRI